MLFSWKERLRNTGAAPTMPESTDRGKVETLYDLVSASGGHYASSALCFNPYCHDFSFTRKRYVSETTLFFLTRSNFNKKVVAILSHSSWLLIGTYYCLGLVSSFKYFSEAETLVACGFQRVRVEGFTPQKRKNSPPFSPQRWKDSPPIPPIMPFVVPPQSPHSAAMCFWK